MIPMVAAYQVQTVWVVTLLKVIFYYGITEHKRFEQSGVNTNLQSSLLRLQRLIVMI